MKLFSSLLGFSSATQGLTAFSVSTSFLPTQPNYPLVNRVKEEKPENMLFALSVLVLLVHLGLAYWLLQPILEPETEAKPLLMQVAMLSIPANKPSIAPTPPAPPQVLKPVEPIKPAVKPLPKKTPPLAQKPVDNTPAETAVEPQAAAPAAASTPTPVTSTAPSKATSTSAETFTEADYHANYASNPKPEYPSVAKSREWEGKVLLRVQVSTDGLSDAVQVEKSSGHDILDKAAIEAVKNWRFTPALRGNNPVPSSVIVPIAFNLQN
jgi:protein TonB